MDQGLTDALAYGSGYLGQGKVADYIPALAGAPADHLGICVLTRDGEFHCRGHWDQMFTMQSISKALLLIYALLELGHEKVFSRVGVEPTGDSFNSIVKLETKGHHPLNPFINAGAIATMGLILEEGRTFVQFMEFLEGLARRPLTIDETVYRSEKETGDLNRSLAYFMKSDQVIQGDVEATLDAYFRMCSILVNTRDLARFGMILANDGQDPLTGEPILSAYYATLVKTLMVTCGMYDSSGEFAIKVGMPAKSGVGGGILALVQGKAGLGVYSPALDEKGNSLCGIKTLEYLSQALDLHYFKGNQ
ncbi:glutaminase A [Proteiniclasticum sp. QWL-01]|nr:glutaminase A [Proteiniclasticum sp. QWL-01]UUM13513.1 glutaminase A [Clostridiaceae bacterium HFYG-1003]WFF74610.1 glutaminase A [Proteiniclasticum sp. QWL-01]